MASFRNYALSETMIHALNELGYITPTPIQEVVIPSALRGESLLATSETGSGKTHSFLIPILDKIDINENEVQAIIFAPTRELAHQTYSFLKEFLPYYDNLRIRLLASGEEKSRSLNKNNINPHIVIATPKRLHDLSFTENAINVMKARYIVLDEADMLTEFGFLSLIDDFIIRLNNPTILVFSATIADNFIAFLDRYIKPDNRFLLSQKKKNPHRINHYAVDIKHQKEIDALISLIKIINPYLCLVFASTKAKVDEIYQELIARNYKVGVLHGDLSTRERKNNMKRILQNEFSIVICSDMASRGLDLEGVSDIINIDLPKDMSFYFHRAGRTGRYNKDGNCYTFYTQDQLERVDRLLASGVELQYFSLKNDILKKEKSTRSKKKKTPNVELEKEIRLAVAKTRSKKVKPGYKKKVKSAIEKAKRRHKRKVIQEDIRKQRVTRYKEEARQRREK